jgi:glycerol-3-phosphate acyltransferase PlsY
MSVLDIALILACYLVGSIPFSHLIGRRVRKVDLFTSGEGNVGARNVWHSVSPAWGVAACSLDILKGVAAFLLATHLGPSALTLWLCGFAVVIGHDFPLFLRGKGGKGVSTGMGFLLCVHPLPVLLSGAVFGLLSLLRVRFNLAIGFGIGSLPLLWLPLFGVPFGSIVLVTLLLVTMGLKRLLDAAHMRQVKERSDWSWD